MNAALYLALGWLVALVLAANAAIPVPGLGLAVFGDALVLGLLVFPAGPPLAGCRLARAWLFRRFIWRRLPQQRDDLCRARIRRHQLRHYDNCDN